jgi:hypothetical protein
VWNSRNYWVNMQDCTNGCADLSYDLDDSSGWEYVFPLVDTTYAFGDEATPVSAPSVLLVHFCSLVDLLLCFYGCC